MRRNPAPILITNGTMLEYMLVRHADAPILEKSKGQNVYRGQNGSDQSALQQDGARPARSVVWLDDSSKHFVRQDGLLCSQEHCTQH